MRGALSARSFLAETHYPNRNTPRILKLPKRIGHFESGDAPHQCTPSTYRTTASKRRNGGGGHPYSSLGTGVIRHGARGVARWRMSARIAWQACQTRRLPPSLPPNPSRQRTSHIERAIDESVLFNRSIPVGRQQGACCGVLMHQGETFDSLFCAAQSHSGGGLSGLTGATGRGSDPLFTRTPNKPFGQVALKLAQHFES